MEATKDVFRVLIGLFVIGMMLSGFFLVGSILLPLTFTDLPLGLSGVIISTLWGGLIIFILFAIFEIAYHIGKSIL